MVKKIALEEHFLSPGFEDYWQTTAGDITPDIYRQAVARLSDFGDMRLEVMDRGGIARSVLAISGPGVQIERDTATAVRKARESNDFLAREIAKRPSRYSGFAHLAMQDAKARRRRARARHARPRLRRRHDQRPHQRAVSRPSLALSVLGAGRGARRA